jgi:hypothetical protein
MKRKNVSKLKEKLGMKMKAGYVDTYIAGLWALIYETRLNYVTTKVICSIFFLLLFKKFMKRKAVFHFLALYVCFTSSLFGETHGKFVLLTILSHRICLKNSSLYNNTACLHLQSLFLHFANKSYLTFKLDQEKIC